MQKSRLQYCRRFAACSSKTGFHAGCSSCEVQDHDTGSPRKGQGVSCLPLPRQRPSLSPCDANSRAISRPMWAKQVSTAFMVQLLCLCRGRRPMRRPPAWFKDCGGGRMPSPRSLHYVPPRLILNRLLLTRLFQRAILFELRKFHQRSSSRLMRSISRGSACI